MRIVIVTPAERGSHAGNRTTAARWSKILRALGHRVTVTPSWRSQACDLLIALHAKKSYPSVARFRERRARGGLIVALTGTDLYTDLPGGGRARASVDAADRLVVLQPNARTALPEASRRKAVVIFQSAKRPRRAASPSRRFFVVCVLAHLRTIKDPLRAAMASRLLPAVSRIRIVHVGRALDRASAARARREAERNARYIWRGDRPHARALRELAASRLMVLSSTNEGGANAVSEALACGIPVLLSRVPGNLGLLGPRYPGYFDAKDTGGLARLMRRAESDPVFLARLRSSCAMRQHLLSPRREARAWQRLLRSVGKMGADPGRLAS